MSFEPGAEPGSAGYEDTLDDEYDTSNIRTDINIEQPVLNPKAFTLPYDSKYTSAPELPFKDHPYPSLINLSNKFRQKGPNKIMYPPKNGPVAMIKKYGGNPSTDLPPYDPFDELTIEIENKTKKEYEHELRGLIAMQCKNELQNIRALNRHKSLNGAQAEISEVHNHKYPGVFIGDIVIRGPDWKWGEQDGQNGLKGTIRGIRRWHPNDCITQITEVVVLWDHGLYGNYRFNYRGAYDVRVIARLNLQSIKMEPVCVGDIVCRKQANWRWGDQDGGKTNSDNDSWNGTIIELYASPAPFEGGARCAVCWDKDKAEWMKKAQQHKLRKTMEEKENGGNHHLNLDEFDYIDVDDDNDNDDDGKDDEKEEEEKKKEEYPPIPNIPNPMSNEPIVSPLAVK